MKTIQVSDETYEFLMELSKEMNSQNHRATAMPYFFQIQTKEIKATPEGIGTRAWHSDGTLIETEEEIKENVFEYKGWDLDNPEHQKLYNELNSYDIDEIMNEYGFREVWYDYEDLYENAFLTEKACKEHIQANKHHYKKPVDFLTHAFRNPEMEKLQQFLCELTNGKLHK